LSAVSSKPGSCKSRRLQGLRKDPHEHAVFSFPTAMRKGADVFDRVFNILERTNTEADVRVCFVPEADFGPPRACWAQLA